MSTAVRRRSAGFASAFFLASLSAAVSLPPARGAGGAVASDERAATEAGIEILRAGGNAVDAAIATALVLVVVEPEAGNLLGGGFAIVKLGSDLHYLDFRETAPAAAHRELYLDDTGTAVPDASMVGPLASGVPGSAAGLYELHRRLGRLPWPKIVAPAERLAREGFVVSGRLAMNLAAKQEVLARFDPTAETWLPAGTPLEAGVEVRLPHLARTLARYASEGPRAVVEGEAAAAIVAASSEHGGILSMEDLRDYRPQWREPVRFEMFGWSVASADLPSSGGILLAITAGLLERSKWADAPRFGARRAHILAESWRRAFADRWLMADPATTAATADELINAERLDQLASSIDWWRATESSSPDASRPVSLEASADTTHLSVVDSESNVVALTTTLNGLFGCGLFVAEVGLFLNNEMDDFATAPGRPNMYGLLQGEANEVGAGKRMLSSQTPTIAWRGGEVVALGGRGGSKIPTATLQVLLNLLVDGDDLQQAVDRPRAHHQWLPDHLVVEADRLAPETRQELTSLGHAIEEAQHIAQVNAVRITAEGIFEAAADPRSAPGHSAIVDPTP